MELRGNDVRTWLIFWLASSGWAADYAGSAACGKCHAAEYESQSQSGHARALAPSKEGQPGEWAFGAGVQATTFVSRVDRANYLEHGETWYRSSNSFAITPGHKDAGGLKYRIFDPNALILRCFSCHSTGPIKLSEDESIVPGELGVRCETCHGPGANHAANPAVNRLRNPGRMNGPQMNTFCGTCHRVVASVEETPDLRSPWNSRHQPLLLAASNCFLKSQGRLTCITCHNPHQALNANPGTYNAACQTCHRTPEHTVPVADRACSECHMPAVRPSATLAFTNHRIGVYSPDDPLSPLVISRKAESRVAVPVLPASARPAAGKR